MLPPKTLNRIFGHVPASLTIDWPHPDPTDGQTYSATLTPVRRWAYQDAEPRYPCIILDRGPVGVERTADQPLSDVIREEVDDTDPTVALHRYEGARVYDVLTLTVAIEEAVTGTAPGGDTTQIPRSVVAAEAAAIVWEQFRYRSAWLNEPGDDYEWPVLVRPLTDGVMHATGQSREMAGDISDLSGAPVERYQMQFMLKYTATTRVVVDAVAQLEGEFTIVDADGTELSTTAWSTSP